MTKHPENGNGVLTFDYGEMDSSTVNPSIMSQRGLLKPRFLAQSTYMHELEVRTLRSKIEELRVELERLKAQQIQEEKVILIREVPYGKAKSEIEQFVKEHETTDLEAIQDALRLDLELIVKIVKELEIEKKIKVG